MRKEITFEEAKKTGLTHATIETMGENGESQIMTLEIGIVEKMIPQPKVKGWVSMPNDKSDKEDLIDLLSSIDLSGIKTAITKGIESGLITDGDPEEKIFSFLKKYEKENKIKLGIDFIYKKEDA